MVPDQRGGTVVRRLRMSHLLGHGSEGEVFLGLPNPQVLDSLQARVLPAAGRSPCLISRNLRGRVAQQAQFGCELDAIRRLAGRRPIVVAITGKRTRERRLPQRSSLCLTQA